MAIIENFFIHFKRPQQIVFAGENYIDVYKFVDKSFQKIHSVEDISIFNIESGNNSGFNEVIRELKDHGDVDTGVILNSGPFIFNIFDFERLPLREILQREMVEWRLRKVFPENIDEYDHQFFKLSKTRVLSVLLKKSLKQKIEELFALNKITLTYIGNSTVNCMNNAIVIKNAPDFLVEGDRTQFIVIFQTNSLPFYIRKFRSTNETEVVAEIVKTINYVKNSYTQAPHSYSVVSNRSDLDFGLVRYELMQHDVRPMDLKKKDNLFLPG